LKIGQTMERWHDRRAIGNTPAAVETAAPQQGDAPVATIEDFDRLDIRVGTIVEVSPFPEARKPAYRMTIDFGPELGQRQSSAQITVHYKPDQLVGRQVLAVMNFPPRRIGPFESQVLTLGVPDEDGAVVLLRPDFRVPDGGRMF
jgi:tRNA-binding protein